MSQATLHIEQIYIEHTQGDIMGSYQHLDPRYMTNLLMAEVDDSLDWPDMFTLRILDPGLELLHADIFKLGTKVKISIRRRADPLREETPPAVELMRGELTSIEPELSTGERSVLVIRGYDLSHKMNRVRRTNTYQRMDDSEIAQQLARGASLLAEVTPTGISYPYLMQANQTDWEFLMERARRAGYRLFVEGKTLHFAPPPASPPARTTLRWGFELSEFQARMSTVDQPDRVTVRGWDTTGKRPIVGQATAPRQSSITRRDQGRAGGQGARQAHSVQGAVTVVDAPVYSPAEADRLAETILTRMASGYVQAEGTAAGNPDIKAGSSVDIDGIGSRFGGEYLVVRARHRYSANEYKTHFWVSGGMGSMTITEILRAGSGYGPQQTGAGHADKPTARGVMVGLVTNNSDPENLGRVKVKIPALGDDVESYWCRMASIMAGPTQGVAYMPEANDEVVVAFQNGDPNYGYVLGAVWNGSDKLPKPLSQLVTGSKTIRRVIRSRVGHEIIIDDSPDPTEGIIIQDKTTKQVIKIITKQKKIVIEAEGDIEVTSTTGKITVQSMGDLSLQSNTGNVQIVAGRSLSVTAGTSVDVTAAGTATLTGGVAATIAAPIVNLG